MKRIQRNNGLDYLYYRRGSGTTVEIFDIAVMSERGKGIGRSMVEELKKRVHPTTRLIWAITRADNEGARKFYAAIGFREMATLPQFYSGSDAVMYGIDL